MKFQFNINIVRYIKKSNLMGIGDWGMGFWELGLGPIPHTREPTPPFPTPNPPIRHF